jgi:flavin reductase (DIM6/NTAB) family NADH-FMN oxidoreductase RutF
MNDLKIIKPEEIQDNIFKLIGSDWMLIAAGNMQKYNMMTASWGFCGVLWNKPMAAIFIRPQRYTLEFTESNETFTLNFFDETYRSILQTMGKESGRNTNKMSVDGLQALESNHGGVYFKQARMVMECKKMYYDDLKPSLFLNPDIEKMYPKSDYHRFYFAEILNSMVRQ